MRQVAFGIYTAGTWDAVLAACETLPHGKEYAACVDTVNHLDGAGRLVEGERKFEPGDLLVVFDDDGEATIFWLDHSGELVQLVKD